MCISYHESIMKGRPVGIAIASGFPTTHASVQVSRAPRRIPECLHLSSQGPYTHLVFQLNRFLLQFPVHAGPHVQLPVGGTIPSATVTSATLPGLMLFRLLSIFHGWLQLYGIIRIAR